MCQANDMGARRRATRAVTDTLNALLGDGPDDAEAARIALLDAAAALHLHLHLQQRPAVPSSEVRQRWKDDADRALSWRASLHQWVRPIACDSASVRGGFALYKCAMPIDTQSPPSPHERQ